MPALKTVENVVISMSETTIRAPTRDDAWIRATASALIHAQLAGRELPHDLPGLTDRQAVDRIARMDAKELLATLRDLYGVAHWDIEAFERAFLEGALDAWRPGALVQHRAQGLRVVSSSCPIASDVEKDPRLCVMCQDIQRHAAYLALVGRVRDVRFERLMSRGESSCEIDIDLR